MAPRRRKALAGAWWSSRLVTSWGLEHGQVLAAGGHGVNHVVLVVGLDDVNLQQAHRDVSSINIVKSGCSGRVVAAMALSMAWRMSSSEMPCLRALGRTSTATTVVVTVSVGYPLGPWAGSRQGSGGAPGRRDGESGCWDDQRVGGRWRPCR